MLRGDPYDARSGRRILELERQVATANRKIGQQQGRITRMRQRTLHECFEANVERNQILDEMEQLQAVQPRGRRYSVNFNKFCCAVLFTSATCYALLRAAGFPLMSRWHLMRQSKNALKHGDLLSDTAYIEEIFTQYKKQNNISGVKGNLAVDAVSFHPQIRITKNGFVNGTSLKEPVSKERVEHMEKSFREFEAFVNSVKNVTFTDAFVFQFQPIRHDYGCIVVHILASTQGKATEHVVDVLMEVVSKLNEVGAETVSLAFDGDSTYSKLHDQFFGNYSSKVTNDYNFVNFSEISSLGVISDPLHLLKRGRYRLLSNDIALGFTERCSRLNVSRARELLNLPSIIFSNQRITKMHDSLPLKLFDLRSLLLLFAEQEYELAAYFIPFTLLSTALAEKYLSNGERVSLLQVSFFYSFLYYQESMTATDNSLPQNRRSNHAIVWLFQNQLMKEMCNTIFVLISALESVNGKLYLNRYVSNPLEHTFGMIRMKSRNRHTFDRMIKSIGEIELVRRIKHDLNITGTLSGRLSEFGSKMENRLTKLGNIFTSDPRDIAHCLHNYIGLPVKNEYLHTPYWPDIPASTREIVDQWFTTLSQMQIRLHPNPQKVKLSSTQLKVGSSGSIINRLKDRSALNDDGWTLDKDDELVRLREQDGREFEDIRANFGGKTVKQLKSRYQKLTGRR